MTAVNDHLACRQLTFDEVTSINRQRCERWHPGFPDDEEWSLADWSNAMCGEAGEAANVVKKLRRIESGHPGLTDPSELELRVALGEELADVYLYLDLLAIKAGIDLPAAIVRKFNVVSDRQDFPERLPWYAIEAGGRNTPKNRKGPVMADNKNRGLYEKYRVERTNSDKPVGPCIVLELDDPNAWPALNAWTDTMEAEGYGLLADDVRRELVARGGRTSDTEEGAR